MLFNSLTFLVFAVAFFAIWPLTKSLRSRHVLLMVSSYIFYGAWSTPFLLLLIFSTVVDYWAGILIARSESQRRRNLLLLASLGYNLGVLFYFKYADFFMDSAGGLFQLVGFNITLPAIKVVLPVGISFYTFVTLSYTLDIWKREIEPETSFIKYAAFVSYWPHLVAGPILRARQLLPQLSKRRRMSWQIFYQGLFLVSFGFFMKVVLADNLAKYVERVYNYPSPPTTSDAWIATYAYALQIFGDFSGYSNIAIGLALWMGIYIPENFNAPYAASSFSDFWRRWHISLSRWLRDYLYIPLGGNRKGEGRTYLNLMATMLLGGLWHGAAWNFVAWGGLHGLYLAGERTLGLDGKSGNKRSSGLARVIRRIVVFQLVCVTWVLFRADFARAGEILRAMGGFARPDAVDLYGGTVKLTILALVIVVVTVQHWFADKTLIGAAKSVRLSKLGYAVLIIVMLVLAIVARGGQGAFIYFQF
jgi:alginate O-acetyltransferase complex protein AlgI